MSIINELVRWQRAINDAMAAMTPEERALAARANLEVIDRINADAEGDDYTPACPQGFHRLAGCILNAAP